MESYGKCQEAEDLGHQQDGPRRKKQTENAYRFQQWCVMPSEEPRELVTHTSTEATGSTLCGADSRDSRSLHHAFVLLVDHGRVLPSVPSKPLLVSPFQRSEAMQFPFGGFGTTKGTVTAW